jgi:hypothetical protein
LKVQDGEQYGEAMRQVSAEAVHTYLIQQLLSMGFIPARDHVASELKVTTTEIEDAYRHLSDEHGLVLHPHVVEPWVIHPFSLSPTLNWVETDSMGWWAPCIWCALGIATLVGGEVRIDTRLGAEQEPLSILVRDGVVAPTQPLLVHFAIPPKRAWDNVHLHCALLLPFRSVPQVESWCERHGASLGAAISLEQAASLAREWYGGYADANWHKWSKAEAQSIFSKVGLTSTFWDLGSDLGGF